MKTNCWQYQYLIVLCFIIYGCDTPLKLVSQELTLYSYICNENDFGNAWKKTFAVYPLTQKVVGKESGWIYQLEDCSVYDYYNWHCKEGVTKEIIVYKGRELFNPLEARRSYKVTGSIIVPIEWYDFLFLRWREENIKAYCKEMLELTKKTANEDQ